MEDPMVEYFTFLDKLRESGVTNMFGAASYLESEFCLSKKESKKILLGWMETFDREKPVSVRVDQFLGLK